MTGTVSSGDIGYAGGERNRIINCAASGLYKNIVSDDVELSPTSAAHATVVRDCDIQGGQYLLSCESQYTAGVLWTGNTVQNIQMRVPGVGDARVMTFAGYDSQLDAAYIEAGGVAGSRILYMMDTSRNNKVRINHATCTAASDLYDLGSENLIEYNEDNGAIPGGYAAGGRLRTLFDRAYKDCWARFYWDSVLEVFVVDAASNYAIGGATQDVITTINRVGAGDYTITHTKPYTTDRYHTQVSMSTNGSAHMGGYTLNSQTNTNVRMTLYAQNGATSTPIDPLFVWVRFTQF